MQRSRTKYLVGTLVGILFCVVCVGGIIYPVALQVTRPSARDALDRFARMPPDRPNDLGIVRQALLQDVPVGITERNIYAYIQQRGVHLTKVVQYDVVETT
jgi:hypothetical protein